MKILKYFIIILTISSACSSSKSFEKQYKERTKELAKLLKEQPPKSQLDSLNWADKVWEPTVNLDIRKPNFVVIHHTAQNSTDQTIKTFQSKERVVSSHYVIGRDGKVVQMVNDYARARHAGVGKWGTNTDFNSCSIGIEMDNNGRTDPWPEIQMDALIQLLTTLKKKYDIPTLNFIGHADYAPNRKVDPYRFPWKKLAENGFGIWMDEDLQEVPEGFNPTAALRLIGYDISNLNNAIRAFKIHFIQERENSPELNEQDLRILYNVYLKFMN